MHKPTSDRERRGAAALQPTPAPFQRKVDGKSLK